MHIHHLNETVHQDFLAEQRIDSITGDVIQAGDRVVFCASCQSVFLLDSWNYMNGTHCKQQETLSAIPNPTAIATLGKPKDTLISTFTSRKRPVNANEKKKLIYIGAGSGLAVLTGLSALTGFDWLYIDVSFYASAATFAMTFMGGMEYFKLKKTLKVTTRTVEFSAAGIPLQKFKFEDLEKIKFIQPLPPQPIQVEVWSKGKRKLHLEIFQNNQTSEQILTLESKLGKHKIEIETVY